MALLPLLGVAAATLVPAHYYNHTFGAIAAGHDLFQQTISTISEAQHPQGRY
jgi:hypothetical protein